MKDYGIDKGLIEYRDDSDRSQRGWSKNGFFGFRKMFRDYLAKLNVSFYDACCPALTDDIFPVRYNDDTGELERYNGEAWVEVALSSGDGAQIVGYFPQAAQDDIAAGTGGAISIANYFTTINTDAGGDAFTLANGTVIGQRKRILLVVDGGGNAVVTPANLAAGTTITFDDAADDVELQWNGADWVVIANIGALVA